MFSPHEKRFYQQFSIYSLTIIFLLIEFFDEFAYAVGYAARPALRIDLGLTYVQVGLLMGLPHIINIFIEPFVLLLGDTSLRKRLMFGGGLGMAAALLLVSAAQSFPVLLFAEILMFPCSGAFVTLSQATLMDINPGRESHAMARWSVAGSLANLIAPLILAGGFVLGMGWRWAYASVALAGFALAFTMGRQSFSGGQSSQLERGAGAAAGIKELLLGAWDTLRNPQLLRWLALLEMSDLMLDVFTDYAALYFADIVGLTSAQIGLALGLMMLAGLISDLALISLLERFPGRSLVRFSATLLIPLYILFLLTPWAWTKIVLAAGVKLATLGCYPVMEAEAFVSAHGRSGTVKAISSLSGLLGGLMISGIGWIADQMGLGVAMWLLLLGPICLVLFAPRAKQDSHV